jgi:two-component sensor histidine kinase
VVTNSIKYGFPDDRPGQILIELDTNDELVLSVSDNGVGMPEPEQAKKGIGSKVVALLTQQLNGASSPMANKTGGSFSGRDEFRDGR